MTRTHACRLGAAFGADLHLPPPFCCCRGSPLSQAVTWELLRRSRAQHMTLAQSLEAEYSLVGRFVSGEADFYEGVRATLIDKGSTPAWKYAAVRDVPRSVVEELLAARGGGPFDGVLGTCSAPTARM